MDWTEPFRWPGLSRAVLVVFLDVSAIAAFSASVMPSLHPESMSPEEEAVLSRARALSHAMFPTPNKALWSPNKAATKLNEVYSLHEDLVEAGRYFGHRGNAAFTKFQRNATQEAEQSAADVPTVSTIFDGSHSGEGTFSTGDNARAKDAPGGVAASRSIAEAPAAADTKVENASGVNVRPSNANLLAKAGTKAAKIPVDNERLSNTTAPGDAVTKDQNASDVEQGTSNTTAPAEVEFFTHHKTGEMLAIEAMRSCFDGSNISVVHTGSSHAELAPSDPQRLVIHFVRDPFSLLVSAYNYHRANTTGEAWLHSAEHLLNAFQGNDLLLNELIQNETYHNFLLRVPPALGMRAEMHRAFDGELERMHNASKVCKANTWCLEVCLEDFVSSSQDYNKTWGSVMRFLGSDTQDLVPHKSTTFMDCLYQFDLNNRENTAMTMFNAHITSDKMPPSWNLALTKRAQFLDDRVYNGSLARQAKAYGCSKQPRPPIKW